MNYRFDYNDTIVLLLRRSACDRAVFTKPRCFNCTMKSRRPRRPCLNMEHLFFVRLNGNDCGRAMSDLRSQVLDECVISLDISKIMREVMPLKMRRRFRNDELCEVVMQSGADSLLSFVCPEGPEGPGGLDDVAPESLTKG